ncbi:MAG: UDP-N-acetylmuramate--L-alanine ligase [Magnetococcales bacterium]|nr:UDP-N-acetylmuramate--L-alanine ligase [Magnetococcales bacterium]MBF0113605.1 UDP-N-acetylmuramate--L-alanine ligase [Magnetococcales bacterium]
MYEKIRRLHFVGIGGIGMSGIAEVLLNLGYRVSGSDLSENASVQRLRSMGATIHIGHAEQNVAETDVVVHSSAVTRDNPELLAARRLRIPIARRAEMLAELMRIKYGIAIAGTHGKTTTTSMVATLLGKAGMDPTVVNGGIVNAFDSNARLGHGDFMVTEADESDGSFLKLFPIIAVVTNMDPEHLDHYGSFDAIRQAFLTFVEKIPFYGLAVLCNDHPEVAALVPRLSDKRIITYGLQDGADYQAVQIRRDGDRTRFAVQRLDPVSTTYHILGEVGLALPGRHNVSNALAAIAVALELEIPWTVIDQSLDQYKGVRRRFDLLRNDPERVIIDDYAHHPTEIAATLQGVREGFGQERRVVALFQPHRYSRVHSLQESFIACFGQADVVLVDRIHPAGEAPLPDISPDAMRQQLIAGIHASSDIPTHALPDGDMQSQGRKELEAFLQPGDVVVFLGAGSITKKARHFAAE